LDIGPIDVSLNTVYGRSTVLMQHRLVTDTATDTERQHSILAVGSVIPQLGQSKSVLSLLRQLPT